MKNPFLIMLLLPVALSAQPINWKLVNQFQDNDKITHCYFSISGIDSIQANELKSLLDSIQKASDCTIANFYANEIAASAPENDRYDSLYIGAVDGINNKVVLYQPPQPLTPNSSRTFWVFLITIVIAVFAIWHTRNKGPESKPVPPAANRGQQIDVPAAVMDAADAIGHRSHEDFAYAVLWAKKIMQRPIDYVILDTETTGTGNKDVVIEVAITDLQGNPIINTKIKPKSLKRIPAAATQIHGITLKDLEDAPSFAEVRDQIAQAVSGKTVLIYNAEFDERLLDQTIYEENTPTISFRNDCVMLKYSQYIGKWNSYYHEYRWQKLPGAGHNALADCQATAKVIEKMASHWPGVVPEK